ncbi:MAG TPA: cbb3-type cytochrome c oxidase subunit I [Puia sp.]|nr:cbb3-type cytochrome c oxidase subunit I [Puia sp.]
MRKELTPILGAGVLMAVVFTLLIWVRDLFTTGLNPFLGSIFLLVVMMLAIPAVIVGVRKLRWPIWKLFTASAVCWLVWTPIWRMRMGNPTIDIHWHDTLFVIANLHFMIFLVLLMAFFATVYFLLEKRGYMNRVVGFIHFLGTFLGCCLLFSWGDGGLVGMPRRYVYYSDFNSFIVYNRTVTTTVLILVGVQLVFVGMVIYYVIKRRLPYRR